MILLYLIICFSIIFGNTPAIQDVIITWQMLSDYFPPTIRNMQSDSDVIGSNNRAGPASTSAAERKYGDGKYVVRMGYNSSNSFSSDTLISIKSVKYTKSGNKTKTLRDAGAQPMRIGLYSAVGILDKRSMKATITVFLDNRVSVEVSVKDTLTLDEARIAFQFIDLDEINSLEPQPGYR